MTNEIKGVCHSPAKNRYLAYINVFNQHIVLGSYKTLTEAKAVRVDAVKYYDNCMENILK